MALLAVPRLIIPASLDSSRLLTFTSHHYFFCLLGCPALSALQPSLQPSPHLVYLCGSGAKKKSKIQQTFRPDLVVKAAKLGVICFVVSGCFTHSYESFVYSVKRIAITNQL